MLEKYAVSIICVFLWIGFVCAISFMEAWLKFQAPGITITLGLGIGRLVFSALNKIEWVLALSILLNILFTKQYHLSLYRILWGIALLILIVQTTWLLPLLDTRAEMYMSGFTPPPSPLHFYYVAAEFIKVVCLFIFGLNLLKTK